MHSRPSSRATDSDTSGGRPLEGPQGRGTNDRGTGTGPHLGLGPFGVSPARVRGGVGARWILYVVGFLVIRLDVAMETGRACRIQLRANTHHVAVIGFIGVRSVSQIGG